MKKLFSMLLCAMILLSAASCSGGKKNESSATSGTESGVSSDTMSSGEEESNGDTDSQTGESGTESIASGGQGNNTPGGNTNTPSNGTKPQEKKLVNNCWTTGYPIAKDQVTFKIMIRDHANGLAKYDDSAFAKYIESKMNIKLKFEAVPPTTAVGDKMALAFSSNNLPDMFWGVATMKSAYIDQGKVKEVGQYLDAYAPNIKKMMKDVPASRYLTTYDDGKTYMLPYVNIPNTPNYSYKLLINKNWLKNVGASMPTTTDELRNVLIKFRDQDANKNGNKNDEIPLMLPGDISPSLFGPFGISTYLNWYNINQKTNKVEFAPATEGYRNGLRYFASLYSEGLLDKNFRGTVAKDIKERANAATPTVGVMATSSGYGEVCSAESYLKNYTVMPPLKGPAGANSTWSYVELENVWAEWMIMSKNCKYPEVAVRLLDYLYSTEGTLVATYGPPGDKNAWKYDKNGKVQFLYKNIPAGKTMTEYCYTLTPGYPIPHYNSKEVSAITAYTDTSTTIGKADKAYGDAVKAMFSSIKPKYVYPKLSFTKEEQKKSASINSGVTTFNNYAHEMRFKFVSGGASLDNNWDSYVAQLKKLGMDETLKIHQQAYNRYRVWMNNNK